MSSAMAWNGLLLLALNTVGALAAAPPIPTSAYVQNTLVPAIRTVLQGTPALNGGILRLAFHDCAGAGGCDGCLNLNLAENAGLGNSVDALENLLGTPAFTGRIGRADLWALAARVVVNNAARGGQQRGGQQPDLLPYSSFKAGRENCASGQFRSSNDVSSNFPSATLGSAGVTSYFAKSFGFTAAESVAIMGAHHIGRARPQVSGFRGPWVPGNAALDGRYYGEMSNAGRQWVQRVVERNRPVNQQKWQWEPSAPNAPQIMMLDADMALFKQLVPEQPSGRVTCPYSGAGACGQAPTSSQVTLYATNRARFQSDFALVFEKMTAVCGRNSAGGAIACGQKLKVVTP